MKTSTIILAVMMIVAPGGSAWADLLVKRDDSVLTGAFKGGSDAAVMFEVEGRLQQVDLDEIFLLAFQTHPGAGSDVASRKTAGVPAPGSMLLVRADHSVLHGDYKGGSGSAILIEVDGELVQVPVGEVILLVPGSPGAPAGKPSSQTAAALPAAGTAPAGTKLMVRLTDKVSTASHGAGSVVQGVLATPLTVEGNVLAPADTKVFGIVVESRGGRATGGSRLLLSFTSLLVGDETVPIKTTEVGAEAGRGGAAKAVGAGALIGAAAGDAATGAAIGGAAAILRSRRNHIEVAAGTMAEVSLLEPATIGGN
jgi:hypothetical protein